MKYDGDRFYVDCGNVHTRVSKQHKIIGNIYENPELLEVADNVSAMSSGGFELLT